MHNYSDMRNKQMVVNICRILPFFKISWTHACKITPFSWFCKFVPCIEKNTPFLSKICSSLVYILIGSRGAGLWWQQIININIKASINKTHSSSACLHICSNGLLLHRAIPGAKSCYGNCKISMVDNLTCAWLSTHVNMVLSITYQCGLSVMTF